MFKKKFLIEYRNLDSNYYGLNHYMYTHINWYNDILPISLSNKMFDLMSNILHLKFPYGVHREEENHFIVKIHDIVNGLISGIPLCCILYYISKYKWEYTPHYKRDNSGCCYVRCFKCLDKNKISFTNNQLSYIGIKGKNNYKLPKSPIPCKIEVKIE